MAWSQRVIGKRLAAVGCAAAMLFCAAMLVRVTTAHLQATGWLNARIACEPKTLDLGELPANTTAPCRFRIRNVGRRPLEIEKVRSGCAACLKLTTQPSATIPPGEHLDLEAVFRTHGLTGLTIRTLSVHSNDPVEPTLVLTLRGSIAAPAAEAAPDSQPAAEDR